MATIFIQKKGPRNNNKWKTIYRTEDMNFGSFLAEELGKHTRAISQTALVKQYGGNGLRKALEECMAEPIPEDEVEKHKEKFQNIVQEPTKDFLLRMPVSLHKKLRKASKEKNMTMSNWILEAMVEKIERAL